MLAQDTLPQLILDLFDNNLTLVIVNPRQKKPYAPEWNDYHMVVISSKEELLEIMKELPSCNLSVHGAKSGLVQVDPDSKNAQQWAIEHGLTSKGAWVIKSARGTKVLYKVPEGITLPRTYTDKNKGEYKLIPDLINELCMVPPSWHPSGVQIQWARGHSPSVIPYQHLASLPQGLLEAWQLLKPTTYQPINRAYTNTTFTPLTIIFDAIVDHIEMLGSRLHSIGDGGFSGNCPLHDDRNPSFSIHPVRGWKCFTGCGEGKLTELAVRLGVTVGG